ncbi:MAG: alpha/beta hydrolase, partial [Chloroflexi bacterium]|nr:alpha/beta hydrolase [Chloroflexota bacterium]
VVKALTLWSVSGGPFASQVLGHDYHVPFMRAAQMGGMAAVAKTVFFAERIQANASNRERLLAMDAEQFAETMMRWDVFFYPQPDMPTIGTTESQLRGIRAPTLVFEGNDDIHCKAASDAVARLVPGAVYVPCPWTREDFMAHYTGKRTGGIMSLYPLITPQVLEFIDRVERKR